jgi:exonuclease III
MALIISTLNIFSFNNKHKIVFIREFLDKNRIDICFIQETHIHDINILNNVKETFSSYEFFYTLTTTNSRGVCIFIKRERNIKIMNEYFDCEKRMHGIEVSFENTTFNFINIYALNSSTSQCEFIQTLYKYLSSKNILFSVEISIILKIVNMRKKIIRIGMIFIKILI